MTRIYHSVAQTPIAVPGNLHELVRGEEQRLLKELEPVVQERSVTLDLRQVERIDAAGIAALITLYGTACTAGHSFTLINPSHRVREILALVKLDRILLSEQQAPSLHDNPCYAMPAA